MKTIAFAIALLPIAFCSAQSARKDGKFKTDKKTGVVYRFIKHNKDGAKPVEGDFARVIMRYVNAQDSLVFDSRTSHNRRPDDSIGTVVIPLKKTFNGCLEQGVEMMAVGDSAIFKVSADSLFHKTFHMQKMPPYAHQGTLLTFYVKLVEFQTLAQIKEQQQQLIAKHKMELAKRKAEEPQIIAKYLSDNHIQATMTLDSLYFLSRQNGNGKQIEEGDSVYIKYTGMLLNGKVFDASDRHGPAHKTLDVIYSKNMRLIKGWILALGTMHEGDKVKILLPSSLAYGDRQMGPDIQPYSPLIFDMEVVKVKPNK